MSNFNRQQHRQIRKNRTKNLLGDLKRPRVVISKSNYYLTAQAIDDSNQKTLAYLCTRNLEINNKENFELGMNFKSKQHAEKLGVEFAKILTDKNINNIVFDRNGYIYHGKIQVFCDAMRKLGINF
jgi:large subunit ribosomal protein L18